MGELRAQRAGERATTAVLATIILGYGMMQTIVVPALPTLQRTFHTSQDTVTWVITSYLLASAVATPIVGRLGDMFGKDRLLVGALAMLTLGSLLSGFASNIGVMVGARTIQGVGGGILPLAFGIVRDEFPREKVASRVGMLSAMAAIGSGVGVACGGPIVAALSYRWLFWIPTIVLAGSCVAARIAVPRSPIRTGGRINWVAATLLVGWLVSLLVAISEAPTWGWGSAKVLGLLAGSVVFVVAWISVEATSSNPLVDMGLMRVKAVWTTNIVGLLTGTFLYAAFAFMPAVLEARPAAGYGFGVSVTDSGLILIPITVFGFVASITSGPLSHRHGGRAVLIVGLVVAAGSMGLLAAGLSSLWMVVLAMALDGVGTGLSYSALSVLVVQGVPLDQTGVATGMNANIRIIGGAIGAAAVSSIVTAGVRSNAFPPHHNYVVAFLVVSMTLVVASAVSLTVPVGRRRGETLPGDHLETAGAGALVADTGNPLPSR